MALADIKIRETVHDIKALDRAANVTDHMKKTLVRSKDHVDNLMDDGYESPSEYAEDRVMYTAEDVTDRVVHDAGEETKKAVRKGKEEYQKHRERVREKRAEEKLQEYDPKFRNTETPRHTDNAQAAKNAHQTDKARQAAARERTVKNVQKRDTIRRAEHKQEAIRNAADARNAGLKIRRNQTIKTVEHNADKTIKQSARSAGKQAVKSGAKGTVKTAEKTVKATERTVKTAEQTSKMAIKTAEATAKATQRAAEAAARAAAKAAELARQAAIAAYKAAVAAAKAIAAAIKAIAAAIAKLIAAIAAGGWMAVLVIVVICLIALIVGSCFGIFFSSEDTGSDTTMKQVVQEINQDYLDALDEEKASVDYDVLEMSGSKAVWPEVLAVYAVKTTTDPDNPQEVATLNDEKIDFLKDIFWEMNEIDSRSETRMETVIIESDDGNGNILEEEVEETTVYLYITVSHKTAEEMAELYNFNEDQLEQLAELLDEKNRSMWSAVLYGVYGGDGQIVAVALSQIGNVGGEPYWSWYGFSSRVEWCACFVSWCANECGYIEDGVIPKYAGCVNGVQWFRDRGQWAYGSAEPEPGWIIFYDWDSPNGESGPQDGLSDHTGIVEKVEDGRVYTVEGNTGDSCRERSYPLGHYEILGYGIPAY